jgi:ribosomal protein L7/L12
VSADILYIYIYYLIVLLHTCYFIKVTKYIGDTMSSTILYEAHCDKCRIDISMGIHDLDGSDVGQWATIACPSCAAALNPISTTDLEDWKTAATTALDANKLQEAYRICRERTGVSFREAKEEVHKLPAFERIREERDALSSLTMGIYHEDLSS